MRVSTNLNPSAFLAFITLIAMAVYALKGGDRVIAFGALLLLCLGYVTQFHVSRKLLAKPSSLDADQLNYLLLGAVSLSSTAFIAGVLASGGLHPHEHWVSLKLIHAAIR